jgi:hypothetical protein
VRIGEQQLLPLAQTLSGAAAASSAPVSTDQGPLLAPRGTPQLSSGERGQVLAGFDGALSGGPPGAAGEIADVFAHRPHGALGAAGYTVGVAVSLVIERSGQVRGKPLQEWIGKVGRTTTELVGSVVRHDTDVAENIMAFFSLIGDGLDLRAELATQRAEDAAGRTGQEARTEAWLQTRIDAVHADPHALDPVIDLAASQLSPAEGTTPP